MEFAVFPQRQYGWGLEAVSRMDTNGKERTKIALDDRGKRENDLEVGSDEN